VRLRLHTKGSRKISDLRWVLGRADGLEKEKDGDDVVLDAKESRVTRPT
jgi:hypothetical protein